MNFLFRGIGQHWTVTLDDEVIEDDFALVSMCNGRYYGGGSTPVPEARMDDGDSTHRSGEKYQPPEICSDCSVPIPMAATARCRRR